MSSTNKSIQEKTTELSKLVDWFDGDQFTLEAALDMFKKAEKLANDIEHDLLLLKNEIKIVKQKFNSDS